MQMQLTWIEKSPAGDKKRTECWSDGEKNEFILPVDLKHPMFLSPMESLGSEKCALVANPFEPSTEVGNRARPRGVEALLQQTPAPQRGTARQPASCHSETKMKKSKFNKQL